MKKKIAAILAVVLCLALASCSGSAGNQGSTETNNNDNGVVTEANKNDNTSAALTIDSQNKIENYIDFSLVKVETTKKIQAPMDSSYYEISDTGMTYVDVILNVTNTSTAGIMSDEMLEAWAVGASGSQYGSVLYALENSGGTDLSQYENLAPLTSGKLHCAVKVAETETNVTIKLKIKGNEYSYDYALGKAVSNAKAITVGETIEAADYATMVFNGIEYTDDLLPSNTSRSYNHYEVDDPASTYLVVKFDITNYQSTAKDIDTFVGAKATFMEKYTYTGFVIVEETDGTGFDSYTDIDPLTTRHFFYLIEVPDTVAGNAVSIQLNFNGQEYIYTQAN